MEINERWLMDTVGWPVFREGRQLYRGGAVGAAHWDPESGLLRGTLVSGRTPRVAGMKILARTDVENLCRCPQSQREGAICAHSAAVAFAWIEEGDFEARPESGDSNPHSENRPVQPTRSPQANSPSGPMLLDQVIRVRLEADFIEIWERGKFPLRFSLIDPNAEAESSTPFSVDLTPEILAACARFSQWMTKNGIDAKSPPPFAVLDTGQAMEFFASVAGYPWLSIGDDGPRLIVAATPIRPPLILAPSEAGEVDENGEPWVQFRLDLEGISGADSNLTLLTAGAKSNAGNSEAAAYLFNSRLSTLIPFPRGGEMLEELLAGEAEVWRPMRWIVEHLDELNDRFHVDCEALGTPIRLITATPQFELALEGSLNSLTAQLHAIYRCADAEGGESELRLPAADQSEISSGEDFNARFPLCDPWQTGLYWQRNLDREKAAAERLEQAGFQAVENLTRWVLQGRDAVLAFFGSELSGWRDSECKVILGERIRHVTRGLERVAPRLENVAESSSGESWFECEFAFATASGATLKDSEVRQLLASGRREIDLSKGAGRRANSAEMPSQGDGVGVIDTQAVEEWQEVLQDLDAEQLQPGRYRIQSHHRDFLRATLGESISSDKGSQDSVDQSVGDLIDVFREYQLNGVRWLCDRLLPTGLGGAVLADEMGLGKTLQALAAVRVLKNSGHPAHSRNPAMVVAPTSLLTNWQAEAERFAPELKAMIYHGAGRDALRNEISQFDLVITSYGVLTRDVEEFRKASTEFGLVALDEASFVRNSRTKAAKAVRKLKCAARLALTGTPVENSVRDLWAILDFVLPGCLGSQEGFRQRYELPLSSESPPNKLLERLKRRVAPHLLRRTKQTVVKELPEKIEQVRFCEMTSAQRSLYAQMVDASRKSVSDALNKKGGGSGQARMIALTALLRLRQICCDPRLLNTKSDEQRDSVADSAKMELLRETIQEARDGGHRVLIFSQFTAMLTLIAEQLDSDGCKYARLDGSSSTTERARAVKLFQSDDSIPAFLISLKAGGYGLNLTAADTVIHFDPWWNPAVEAQATDRAHRIGQARPVTSLKLICRGTVEEKILRLQKRKTATFEGTIEDGAPLMTGLSEEDLREALDL